MKTDIFGALNNFFKNYRKISYKKGENIFRPGDIFNFVYYIDEGYVRLFSVTADGREVTSNNFKPVFPLSYYYAKSKKENRFYFQAVTSTELYSAPTSDFLKFLKNNPEIERGINDMYMEKLEELLLECQNKASGKAYQKVAVLISSLVHKYGQEEGDVLKVDFGITHDIIASLSGISRETATIQISKLEKDGFMKRDGKQLVIDKKKYQEYLEENDLV